MKDYNGKLREISPRASLAGMGTWMEKKGIWGWIESGVKIKQKVKKYEPLEKLKSAFVNILAGGRGIVEINELVRHDLGLLAAFGLGECAEQSTISETLNACSGENVEEMRKALKKIYQAEGKGYHHNYEEGMLILDIDMSAMLSGKQAEGASKGYFSGHENRRGRQLGRVFANQYREIVVDKLYVGTMQLEKSLPELVEMEENVLDLDEEKRKQTLLRIDAGGGTDSDINYMLNKQYLVMTKVKNWQRTCKLVKSVQKWQALSQLPDHECGWVEEKHAYERETRQLAVRWPKSEKDKKESKGQDIWHYCVLVFNLSDARIYEVVGKTLTETCTETELLSTIIDAYDQRGGGVETSFRNSKQGLGLTKRNKKSFAAQESLVLLAQLAYNTVGWFQDELAVHCANVVSLGMMRMIRDVFQILGKIRLDNQGHIISITLKKGAKFAKALVDLSKSSAFLPTITVRTI